MAIEVRMVQVPTRPAEPPKDEAPRPRVKVPGLVVSEDPGCDRRPPARPEPHSGFLADVRIPGR